MRRFTTIALVCVAVTAIALQAPPVGAANARPKRLTIVKKGVTDYVIVVPEGASKKVDKAGRELSRYIDGISGASFKYAKSSSRIDGPAIYVGQTEQAKEAGVTVDQGAYPTKERYRIKTVGQDIFLVGNDAWNYDGTAYAVFDFLERLGCRWYMPGPKGRVIPRNRTITIDALDVDESPDFIERSGVWYEYSGENSGQAHFELQEWRRHNRMAARWMPIGHNMKRIIPPKKYFETHPEWYPEIEGKRQTEGSDGRMWHPCVSSTALQGLVTDHIIDAFESNKDMRGLSLALNDSGTAGWCQCDACKAMGATKEPYRHNQFTKRYLGFVDKVARPVAKRFPDHFVTASAYASTQTPPKGMKPLPENVFLVIMHYYWSDQCKPLRDDPYYRKVFEEFARLSPGGLGIYQYYGDFHYDQLPTPAWSFMDAEFDFYKKTGVRMMTIEGGNQWAVNALTYYVCARMTWDGSLDPNAIVDDFCKIFFGPAEKAMRRYFDLRVEAFKRGDKCERNPRKIPYQEYLDRFDEALTAAVAAAPDKPYRDRIAYYERYQGYMRKYYEVIDTFDAFKEKKSSESAALAEKTLADFTTLVEELGNEGAIAKPSAEHYTLGWMNKSLTELKEAAKGS